MYLIECQNDQFPCAFELQNKIVVMTTEHFAALGVTSESIAQSIAIGFGFVLSFAIAGYVVGIAKKLVNFL